MISSNFVDENTVMVGCVMSNQSRKDFPAAFEAFNRLKQEYGNHFRAWLHTDTTLRYWNVHALARDYGVGDCLEVSSSLNDSQLACMYSACSCTILPSGGEGFGFPIAESMACGSPCVVTNYAGGAELVEESCRINPIAYRVDGVHNVLRAVLSGHAFAMGAIENIEKQRADKAGRSEELVHSVSHLFWPNLKSEWEKWLRLGIR
jgi:glycosyltransferase involved in cell wall biosynthesis